MYEEHIRAAARSMAENMQRSPVPMYGKVLRLPDKGAVIGLLKEIRRLNCLNRWAGNSITLSTLHASPSYSDCFRLSSA